MASRVSAPHLRRALVLASWSLLVACVERPPSGTLNSAPPGTSPDAEPARDGSLARDADLSVTSDARSPDATGPEDASIAADASSSTDSAPRRDAEPAVDAEAAADAAPAADAGRDGGRADSGPVDPVCVGVDCGAGHCVVHFPFGTPECVCDQGYLPYRLGCSPERRLACRAADGSLAMRSTKRCSPDDLHIEVCSDGDGDGLVEWISGVACNSGTTCSQGCLNAPCPEQPCPIGTACVESAHGQALGVCVPTCDCSNCSNCGPDNSDGRWDDWQESCGSPMGNVNTPPADACRMPCPNAGDGCIPYDPSICWPIEGCFSATP